MSDMNTSVDKNEKVLSQILCPFCSHPWDESMIELYASASMSCETCGPEVEASVDITCGECKRLIYRKEY